MESVSKRFLDLTFSLTVFLLLLWWFLPLMALIIRLESKGNPFFVQQRTGYKNQTFKCYKLRSMRLNQESEVLQANDEDHRLTRVGRFIRKWNIDEFPTITLYQY